MPQLTINRNDIDIYIKDDELYVSMVVTNNLNKVNDLYTIRLNTSEQ